MAPTSTQSRVAAGVPAGGQFAGLDRADGDVVLASNDIDISVALSAILGRFYPDAFELTFTMTGGRPDPETLRTFSGDILVDFNSTSTPKATAVWSELRDALRDLDPDSGIVDDGTIRVIPKRPEPTVKETVEPRSVHWKNIVDDFENRLELVSPATHRDLTSALSNVRGEPGGKLRFVYVTGDSTRHANGGWPASSQYRVRAPQDGRPLLVELASGIPFLEVTQGRVVVDSHSASGNSITVRGNAHVTVIARAGAKTTVNVFDEGRVDVIEENGARLGYFDSRDHDAAAPRIQSLSL